MNNQQLQARKHAVIAKGQGNLYPVYIERAKNAEVWDVEGNRFIDLGTGIAVCNTGHSHPKIVAAVTAQLNQFSHSCFMVNPYEVAVDLAERIIRHVPGTSEKKAVFVTTGAEAVENAIKIARAKTKRRGVIAFHGGFHGRTNLTMAITGKVAPYKKGFGPFPAEIYHVPYPIAAHDVTVDDALHALTMLFKVDIDPSEVAAIILEPIQGEGGFYSAPNGFMQALRSLCDTHGIALIVDEIQTGFARTGTFFCHESSGIEADLVTMAKGMAGGFPLAAVVGKSEFMDAADAGGLGGTYGGSPIGCAAALAVLEIIEEESLLQKAKQIGAAFATALGQLAERHPNTVLDVRIRGAMIAVELVEEGNPKKPNVKLTQQLIAGAKDAGLILLACGINSNVIRFLPALTIEDHTLQEALERFSALFDRCLAEQ